MSPLRFGYNTNGFAHHRLGQALVIIAELGYRGVALTLDHHVLNPFDRTLLRSQIPKVKRLLEQLRLDAVVETGSRFLLDPWRKHQPTLVSRRPTERMQRLEFLNKAVSIATQLDSNLVSFWSGAALDEGPTRIHMNRLVEGCRRLSDVAAKKKVRLAFEPEPGMFIDSMSKFEELFDRVDHPYFGLTLDIGHLHCQGETPIENQLRRWRNVLWNIHIEDMKRGIHEHLMFGKGEIDFPPILQVLAEIEYSFAIHVELSRHSHDAVNIARLALEFLRAASS